MDDSTTKTCCTCGKTVDRSDFHRKANSKDGLTSSCKACACERSRQWYVDNPERVRERGKEYLASEEGRRVHREAQRRYQRTPKGASSNRSRVRRFDIKNRYGLTVEEYLILLARGCAICGTQEGQMNLDHDHATGEVRDALCGNCNRGLGQFRDRPDHLLRAVAYLEAHGRKL